MEKTNSTAMPDFSNHIPSLLQNYAHAWKEHGPGMLGVSFNNSNGQCDVTYHKEDSIPDKIKCDMLKFQEEQCGGDVSFIIFHDSDSPFYNGQLRCFAKKHNK